MRLRLASSLLLPAEIFFQLLTPAIAQPVASTAAIPITEIGGRTIYQVERVELADSFTLQPATESGQGK
jgi:hypothetical protein